MRTLIAAACIALGLVAQPAVAAAPQKPRPAGKPQAPVEITADLAAGSARVQVLFQSASSAVDVRIGGLDGLKIVSATRPVTGVSFQPGQMIVIDVAFEAPPGQSNIVVTVSGRFAGAKSARTTTFTVGKASDVQKQNAAADQQTDSKGERIQVVPAEPAKN